jgi:hypothetical protein
MKDKIEEVIRVVVRRRGLDVVSIRWPDDDTVRATLRMPHAELAGWVELDGEAFFAQPTHFDKFVDRHVCDLRTVMFEEWHFSQLRKSYPDLVLLRRNAACPCGGVITDISFKGRTWSCADPRAAVAVFRDTHPFPVRVAIPRGGAVDVVEAEEGN